MVVVAVPADQRYARRSEFSSVGRSCAAKQSCRVVETRATGTWMSFLWKIVPGMRTMRTGIYPYDKVVLRASRFYFSRI